MRNNRFLTYGIENIPGKGCISEGTSRNLVQMGLELIWMAECAGHSRLPLRIIWRLCCTEGNYLSLITLLFLPSPDLVAKQYQTNVKSGSSPKKEGEEKGGERDGESERKHKLSVLKRRTKDGKCKFRICGGKKRKYERSRVKWAKPGPSEMATQTAMLFVPPHHSGFTSSSFPHHSCFPAPHYASFPASRISKC